MDSDGGNHRFITNGQALAISPRFSPDYKKIVYVSYLNNRVRVFIYDVAAGSQKLVTESANATFAPRWSPDGTQILYSMAVGGNTDIYRISANGGTPVRLTNTPGIDVGGSRSEEHTSELQSLMRNSYAVFCLKKTKNNKHNRTCTNQ